MNIDVQIDIRAVTKLAEVFPKEVGESLGIFTERVGRKMEREAKAGAPVVTGNLRRQIRFIRSSPVAGVVKSFANYSPYVHGEPFYQNKIMRKETPFLTNALASSDGFIQSEARAIIPRVLKHFR